MEIEYVAIARNYCNGPIAQIRVNNKFFAHVYERGVCCSEFSNAIGVTFISPFALDSSISVDIIPEVLGMFVQHVSQNGVQA